jgi:hypothetical protein
MRKFNCEKSTPKMWATFEIFKKLTKVKDDPISEKSLNLAILVFSFAQEKIGLCF